MIDLTLFLIGFTVLLIASITDIRIREVPDWLSYSFFFTAISANLILSIIQGDYWIILDSVLGGILGFLIGLILFYAGQWGGGDSKILIGLFALIGFNMQMFYNLLIGNIAIINYLLVSKWFLFIVNFALAGALYGVLFSVGLIIKKKKEFLKEFKVIFKSKGIKGIKRFIINFTFAIIIIFIINFFLKVFSDNPLALLIGFIPFIIFYVWVAAKAIDSGCMNKKVNANKITIGDWVLNDVFIKRRTKNLLKEAYKEFHIREDKKLSLDVFTANIALKYRKHKKGFFSMLFLSWNKKELAKEVHFVKSIMQSSSVSAAMKKSKFLKIDKKQIGAFVEFLKSLNIYFDKFLVCSFQNTGLTENQVRVINELYKKKKINKIKIKNGLPFIPSFLLGFLVFYFLSFWWNFLL